MNRKVFFSYSWKDIKVASRLYGDLVRSGLNVWRDQIDGDPTEDFIEEFLLKIDECDDFIILDSTNYRHKSNWCLTEIERCFQNRKKRSSPRVIVCLLEKDGTWRREYDSDKHRVLFSKINRFKYMTLFYDGSYDNEDVYQKSLTEICALFSKRYIPWNVLPSSRDLLDELLTSDVLIRDKDRRLIIRGFEYISRLVELQRDCDRHFQLWIDDCQSFGLKLFFPRWTYAVWLANEAHQEGSLEKSLNEFRNLANEFPLDPRGFRGWGCAAAQLNYYEESANALKEALRLMGLSENSWHKTHSQLEVLSILGQVLINYGDRNSALEYLRQALDLMESQNTYESQLVLNIVECLLFSKKIDDCKKLLFRLTEKYPVEGELFEALGKIFAVEGDYKNALKAFQSACTLLPSIQNRFYLLCQKKAIGILTDSEIEDALNGPVVQDEDYYWKGAICYYFLGNIRRAKEFYNSCEKKYEWYE